MNSPHHPHHEHHDVHQQRLLWFFSFCNQRSSSSSSSSSGSGSTVATRRGSGRRKSGASNRNKFATQYQQQLQQQQRQSSNVFGRDLTEHTQLFSDDEPIPNIVRSCTRFIEKHGIIFGIYRLSGMRVNIHKLRQEFDKNPKISMIDSEAISNDAHAVACVLKQYFRELPTPLLTFHMYEKFIELFKHNTTNNNNNNSTTTNNNNNNNTNHELDNVDDDRAKIDTIDGQQEHNDSSGDEIFHDNNSKSCGDVAKTSKQITMTKKAHPSTTTTTKPMTINLESNPAKESQAQKTFTTSASDSQLISLSSVVTTTTSDVKYQVKLGDLRRLLLQLPRAHYQTLKFLMCHLACIAANGKKTGMDSKNVAIVWAPNLLKPKELELSAGLETLQIIGLQAVITEQLIKHHKFLFEDENDNINTTSTPTTTPSTDRAEHTSTVFRQEKLEENSENTPQHQNVVSSPLTRQLLEPMHKDQSEQSSKELEEHDLKSQMRDENQENNFSES